jgi:hypothetical protein
MKTKSLILWGVAAFVGYKLYKNHQSKKLAEAQKKAMDEAAEEFEQPEAMVDSQFSNASYGAAAAYRGRLIPDNLRHGWGQRGGVRNSMFNDVVMAEYGRLIPMAWQVSEGKKYRFSNAVNDCAGSAGGSCYTWIRINGIPTQVQGTIGSDCKCNPTQRSLSVRSTTGSIV